MDINDQVEGGIQEGNHRGGSPDMVSEQSPMDRLCREIGGALFAGTSDGGGVVKACDDKDRSEISCRSCAVRHRSGSHPCRA